MRLLSPLLLFALLVLAAYAPHPTGLTPTASAADSTDWENLQVLPDSLSRDELIGMMRGFTDALGVRCGYCHVREDGDWAFPSDANPHKEVARGMLRMTRQINEEILPAIDGLHEASGRRVTCYTCHQGATRPLSAAPSEDATTNPPGDHDHGDGQ